MKHRRNSEIDLLAAATDSLHSRLPPGWLLERLGPETIPETSRFWENAAFRVTSPQGVSATIVTEAKSRPVEARAVPSLLERWERTLSSFGDGFMVLSPFLGLSARERLAEAGISYADATGNMRFTVSSPAVFVETQGENRNRSQENEPLRSLKGRGAARIVRGLLDYRPPYGVREFADLIGSAPASVSRVVSMLEKESIAMRKGPRGSVFSLDWERLLRRWAVDYSFRGSNRVFRYQYPKFPNLAPRELTMLLDTLRDSGLVYAVTGSFAAYRRGLVPQPRKLSLYVRDPSEAVKALDLQPVETGGNVLMGRPFDPVAFDRTTRTDGIVYVADSQAAEDLMTGTRRSPEEAEPLVEWMRSHEAAWRQDAAIGNQLHNNTDSAGYGG